MFSKHSFSLAVRLGQCIICGRYVAEEEEHPVRFSLQTEFHGLRQTEFVMHDACLVSFDFFWKNFMDFNRSIQSPSTIATLDKRFLPAPRSAWSLLASGRNSYGARSKKSHSMFGLRKERRNGMRPLRSLRWEVPRIL